MDQVYLARHVIVKEIVSLHGTEVSVGGAVIVLVVHRRLFFMPIHVHSCERKMRQRPTV